MPTQVSDVHVGQRPALTHHLIEVGWTEENEVMYAGVNVKLAATIARHYTGDQCRALMQVIDQRISELRAILAPARSPEPAKRCYCHCHGVLTHCFNDPACCDEQNILLNGI